MSGYVKNVIIKTQFDGDTVTAVMRPISLIDRIELEDQVPYKSDAPEVRGTKSALLAPKLPAIVASYLVSIEGLRDNSGEPLGHEIITRDGYFSDLTGTLFRDWFAQRAPKDPTPPAAATTDASADSRSPSESPKSASAG